MPGASLDNTFSWNKFFAVWEDTWVPNKCFSSIPSGQLCIGKCCCHHVGFIKVQTPEIASPSCMQLLR